MQVLINLRNKVSALNTQIFALLVDTLNDSTVKAQVEDKIGEQLQRGERGDNQKLRNYSPVSVAKFGKPAGPIRLFDTGDFYQRVTVEVFPDGIVITDTDSKTEMLVDEYGKEIIELQERSIEELQEDVFLPNLQARVIKHLTR